MIIRGRMPTRLELLLAEKRRRQAVRATGLSGDDAEMKELAEAHFLDFVRLHWHVLEPASRPFISGWAMDAIAEHLEAVHRGWIRRLLITLPPGFSKSLLTSVFFPAWELGPRNQPGNRYICVAHNLQDLAMRDSRRCRSVLASTIYRRMWGERVQIGGVGETPGKDTEKFFNTTATGWRLALATGGVTGERADRFISDDLHPVGESDLERAGTVTWYAEAVPSRINDPDLSAFITIGQCTAGNDVPAHLRAHRELGYVELCIPMFHEHDHPQVFDFGYIGPVRNPTGFRDPRREDGELAFPERFGPQAVKELVDSLESLGGSHAVNAQLQQRPSPRGGAKFKRAWFRIVQPGEVEREFGLNGITVRGWDFAWTKKKKSDWTATGICRITPAGIVLLSHVYQFKGSPGEVKSEFKSIHGQDPRTVFWSCPKDPSAGTAVAFEYAQLLHGRDFEFTPEEGNKPERATPLAAQAECGTVVLVDGPYAQSMLEQAEVFPYGSHDDLIDWASRAYNKASIFHGVDGATSIGAPPSTLTAAAAPYASPFASAPVPGL